MCFEWTTFCALHQLYACQTDLHQFSQPNMYSHNYATCKNRHEPTKNVACLSVSMAKQEKTISPFALWTVGSNRGVDFLLMWVSNMFSVAFRSTRACMSFAPCSSKQPGTVIRFGVSCPKAHYSEISCKLNTPHVTHRKSAATERHEEYRYRTVTVSVSRHSHDHQAVCWV